MARYVCLTGSPNEHFQQEAADSVFIYPTDGDKPDESHARVPRWVSDIMDSGDRSDPRLETQGVAFVWDDHRWTYFAKTIKMDDANVDHEDDLVMTWLEILEADDRYDEDDEDN
ncbi:hypothetical protein ml_86 [Mollivirus sibericum]|uniref:hypothetical protein n=1 Tax=Mollivirus sibericum TaxID=1678078 RepID=UPI0006B2EFBA|nr:hypothetical protein ml_86 [Mollivirus sibericum]ALD61888.1 hypothetical protein ml_86 [Mollivirus sibericum]